MHVACPANLRAALLHRHGNHVITIPQELAGVSLRHERVSVNGIALHIVVAGSGQPVVLLHGFPEHWWSWRNQIPALAHANYSVWVPDLRGYNLSDRPLQIDAYDLRHLVADVAGVVRATGAERAHIAGHDWGGIIAWSLAGHYPAFVDKLVILNAPHLDVYARKVWKTDQCVRSAYVPFFALPWLPERVLSARRFTLLRTMMRRLAVRKGALSDSDIERYVRALSPDGALTAALNYYRANIRRDPMAWARASRTAAETLVLWGLDDPGLSPVLLDGITAFAPRAHVHRLPGVGHWVHAEAADQVNATLLQFLS